MKYPPILAPPIEEQPLLRAFTESLDQVCKATTTTSKEIDSSMLWNCSFLCISILATQDLALEFLTTERERSQNVYIENTNERTMGCY